MSILINGMEMPKSCLQGGCPIDGASCGLWEEKYWKSPYEPYRKRHSKCPLIQVPSADVREVVHGHWNKDRLPSTGGGTYGVYVCSVCGSCFQEVGYGWDFCPDCGAEMDGEAE